VPTLVAPLIDVVCVLVFVLIGRRNHDEGEALVEVLRTLAPFVIGLTAGWALLARTAQRGVAWRSGIVVWAATVVVGLILRRVAFDRGTAFSFVVVATLFLGVFLVGWRLLAARFASWGHRRAAD
jgi:hypothetical protein